MAEMESPIQLMTKPLKRYAEFSGRSRRMEFFMFFILYIVGIIVASILDGLLGMSGMIGGAYGPLSMLFLLGIIVPMIACQIRRMHDQDRSGWWIIVPIAGFIFLFLEGTKGDNRFGPDPKAGVS
jgi:uncharacterized membrane protein YhaH (DUF805 family)